jgi:hypothetical protein
MYKITAEDPRVPPRETGKDAQFPLSDFMLNPVVLRFIGSAIEEASGLTTENAMFSESKKRAEFTMMWALEQLCSLEEYEHPGRQLWKKLWDRALTAVERVDKADRGKEVVKEVVNTVCEE